MKTKALQLAISAAFVLGTATLSTATLADVEGAKVRTENAVDNTIDKIPPKRMMSRAEYSSEKDSIEANYKTAKASCDSMTGNSKEVCKVEAKRDEKVKLADLEAQYKGTPSADKDARVTKAKAEYDVAKQKCDDLASAEKSACKKQAKTDESRAISDAKAAAKTASSN